LIIVVTRTLGSMIVLGMFAVLLPAFDDWSWCLISCMPVRGGSMTVVLGGERL
jgi:hypothetical protein